MNHKEDISYDSLVKKNQAKQNCVLKNNGIAEPTVLWEGMPKFLLSGRSFIGKEMQKENFGDSIHVPSAKLYSYIGYAFP